MRAAYAYKAIETLAAHGWPRRVIALLAGLSLKRVEIILSGRRARSTIEIKEAAR
jgi:hypothetical protein